MKKWKVLYYDTLKQVSTGTDVKGWIITATDEGIMQFCKFFTRNWTRYNVFAEEVRE